MKRVLLLALSFFVSTQVLAAEYDAVARSWHSKRISRDEIQSRTVQMINLVKSHKSNCQIQTSTDAQGNMTIQLSKWGSSNSITVRGSGYTYDLKRAVPSSEGSSDQYADSTDKSKARHVLWIQRADDRGSEGPSYFINISTEYYGTINGYTDWYWPSTLNYWNHTHLPAQESDEIQCLVNY